MNEKYKNFVFIIPSYNNEKWVYKNIKSIVNQNYHFWRIIYIDDYGNWKGAKQAVDEFFIERKINPFLIRTSSASRIFIKNI